MRRILVSAGLLLGLTLAGVFGYRLIEGASWVDAFYMTVITLSTVGYGEVFPLSPMGRIFTAGLSSSASVWCSASPALGCVA